MAKTHEHKLGNGEIFVERLDDGTGFKVITGADPKKQKSLSESISTTTADMLNRKSLREAATTSEFPNELREDFKTISLAAYNAVPDCMFPIFFKVNSTKQSETYRGINKLKKTPGERRENAPFYMLGTTEKDTVTITNGWHGGIVEITQDMIMFDKSGEISRLATELGESYKYERFVLLTEILTAAANTTAASSTVTLTPTNLENMITTYRTQTDTASSKILNLYPDTLVVPAALEWTARRILESPGIPGSANNDINVVKNIVNLVVNPLLDASTTSRYSTTRFYLGKANNANGLIYQNVIGPEPEYMTQDARKETTSDDCFIYNLIRYKAQGFYGQGIVDNRLWHRSTT